MITLIPAVSQHVNRSQVAYECIRARARNRRSQHIDKRLRHWHTGGGVVPATKRSATYNSPNKQSTQKENYAISFGANRLQQQKVQQKDACGNLQRKAKTCRPRASFRRAYWCTTAALQPRLRLPSRIPLCQALGGSLTNCTCHLCLQEAPRHARTRQVILQPTHQSVPRTSVQVRRLPNNLNHTTNMTCSPRATKCTPTHDPAAVRFLRHDHRWTASQ